MTQRAKPQRIQLRRTKGWRKPADTIVVARPSKWGNPFTIQKLRGKFWIVTDLFNLAAGTTGVPPMFPTQFLAATLAVDMFESHIGVLGSYEYDTPDHDLNELSGRELACWCPLADEAGNRWPCHADVLLRLSNR